MNVSYPLKTGKSHFYRMQRVSIFLGFLVVSHVIMPGILNTEYSPGFSNIILLRESTHFSIATERHDNFCPTN